MLLQKSGLSQGAFSLGNLSKELFLGVFLYGCLLFQGIVLEFLCEEAFYQNQNQLPGSVIKRMFSLRFLKIRRKTSVVESLLVKMQASIPPEITYGSLMI